jgi:hypothetical protein
MSVSTMRYKGLMCALQNKKGDFWQVLLTKEQQGMVASFIEQLHGGAIKVIDNKLPIYFEKKGELRWTC